MNDTKKRTMKTPAAFVGKRVNPDKWTLPAGWHCCPDTGVLQSDAQETDEAIAATVECIRLYQQQQEAAATRIYELKDTLEALLKRRGSNWQDDDGYARLVGESTRVNYRREELDALILQDPVQYGWLKQYRHESTVAGRVAVK